VSANGGGVDVVQN